MLEALGQGSCGLWEAPQYVPIYISDVFVRPSVIPTADATIWDSKSPEILVHIYKTVRRCIQLSICNTPVERAKPTRGARIQGHAGPLNSLF